MDEEGVPMIRFAGGWIPAYEAWSWMETAMVAVNHIERFNERFPDLATEETQAVIPTVRARLKSVELVMPKRPERAPEIRSQALRLLHDHSPEEAIDALQAEFGGELNLHTLLAVVGMPAYLAALGREGQVLVRNKISPEQTARLWNDQGRVAPGGGAWTAALVERLLENRGL